MRFSPPLVRGWPFPVRPPLHCGGHLSYLPTEALWPRQVGFWGSGPFTPLFRPSHFVASSSFASSWPRSGGCFFFVVLGDHPGVVGFIRTPLLSPLPGGPVATVVWP